MIAIALVAAISSFSVNAQEIPERKHEGFKPHQGPGMMRHHRPGGMDLKALNLTDAQKEQLKKQREDFRKEMEALKKNDNITVKEWRTKMESLRKEQKSGLEKVLTADQKAQLEKMKADGKARQEEMMKKRGDMMKTRLGLTDEQAAKMEQNRKTMGDKMKALRENKSLNEDARREQVKEIMKEHKENLKSILTEEQLKKMREGGPRGKHPGGERHGMKKEII